MPSKITSRPLTHSTYLRVVIASLAGALLLTAGSKISLPAYPVPTTLQMFAVFSLIIFYPARLAFTSVVAWLALGMVFPVFADKLGQPPAFTATVLFSPSGGYVAGMLLATAVITLPLFRIAGLYGNLVKLAVTTALVYALGLYWLSLYFPGKALQFGLYPFVGLDLVKLFLALAFGFLMPKVRRNIRRNIFGS